jgi:hypothetical protein
VPYRLAGPIEWIAVVIIAIFGGCSRWISKWMYSSTTTSNR